MAPVIGITGTLKEDGEPQGTRPLGRYVRADLDYVEGVAQAGGVPVVLPPVGGYEGTLIETIDGLVLSGGSDLNPEYYGEEPLPEMGVTIPERDEFEMALLEHALKWNIPIFGICRGMQVLNVALGGTLYQDLPSQFDSEIKHRQSTPKSQPTHEVEVNISSKVAEILGDTSAKVNSYHHQAIKDLAGGLEACGWASDGTIEAVEAADYPDRWLVGVQWHAEAMRQTKPENRNLFWALVHAAERHSMRRAA